MGLWGTFRTEVGGAVRSVGYDVRQRIATFGVRTESAYPEYDVYARRPRRLLKGSGIAVLAAGGVAGTYLALAGGLGGWLLDSGHSSDTSGRPDQGTSTTAAHGPDSTPGPAPKATLAPGTPPHAGTVSHRPQAAPTPSPSGRPGTRKPSPGPSMKPTTPPTVGPTPTPTPTPTPSSTPSDPPTGDPSDPAPDPTDSTASAQLGDTPPLGVSATRSTLIPTGA